MKKIHIVLFVLLGMLLSCGDGKRATGEWRKENNVLVAIDESFAPIMEEEMDTYGLKYPEAKMMPILCSEDSAFSLLLSDSVKMIIATRGLSSQEKDYLKSRSYVPTQAVIAYDALAIIVHKESQDTLLTLDELKGIVTGKITRWEQLSHHQRSGELKLVFDHSGSSTVRYMRDSLNEGKALSGNLFAQGSNLAVIETVKKDPSVIGVIGADWLKKKGEEALSDFSNLEVKTMKVSRFSGSDAAYFRPYQFYIATGQYPLIRSVHMIETDPRSSSHLKNFFFFLKGQNGQTILLNHSQMLPNKRVQVKNVMITE